MATKAESEIIVVSAKQLAANRLNSLRSSGPRTPAGKAASRCNAIKHGLLAKLPVLAALGETPEAWATHREAILGDLAPVGPVQTTLAERVALLLWRMARAAGADTAAAAVGFLPTAAVPTPPTDPTAVNSAAVQAQTLRRKLTAARARATAHRRALELFDCLADASDDEPLDHGTAKALWAAALRSLRMDPEYEGEHQALPVLEREGVKGSDLALDRRYHGWTVRRLRAGLEYLAEGKGPVSELLPVARGWILDALGKADQKVQELEAALAVAEGERVAARVGPALEKAAGGWETLEYIGRYEQRLGAELTRMLTLYYALQTTRLSQGTGTSDYGEVVG